MSAHKSAHAHVAKAGEFLQAAALSCDRQLFSAAASAAAISGVNSKDAICLASTGRSDKSDDHARAVGELRQSGPVGREAATVLARLLRLKSASQYRATPVSATDAAKAVDWAARLHELARRAVAG